MDHHNVDTVGFQLLQHLLELGPVGGLGRLASVHVLLDQDTAELPDFVQAGFALGRDRVALQLTAHLGLLLSTDPDVDRDAERTLTRNDRLTEALAHDRSQSAVRLVQLGDQALECRAIFVVSIRLDVLDLLRFSVHSVLLSY